MKQTLPTSHHSSHSSKYLPNGGAGQQDESREEPVRARCLGLDTGFADRVFVTLRVAHGFVAPERDLQSPGEAEGSEWGCGARMHLRGGLEM